MFSIVATAIVAYILLSPPTAVTSSWFSWLHFKHSDKVVHGLLFFFLNFAYLFDYIKFRNPHHTSINKDLMLTVLASALGLLSETAQLVMALGREYEKGDIIADVIGAVLALLFMRWKGGHWLRKNVFSKKRKHHHHHHHHHSSSSNVNSSNGNNSNESTDQKG